MDINSLKRQVGEEADALRALLGRGAGRSRSDFLRSWARYPLRYRAQQSVESVSSVSVDEALADLGAAPLPLSAAHGDDERHPWGLRRLDQEVLVAMVGAVGASRVFEIGTFDGGTTALLVEAVGPTGEVFTLDLPPSAFDATQAPPEFDGSMVGWRYAGSPGAERITQLFGDSKTFDYSPWFGSIDVVFVDAGHDYPHGAADSANALRLVRDGGLVVWDDFVPHWWGLVQAIVEVVGERGLKRVEGTNLAYLKASGSSR
jgi:predicted O-methyltransferase YrrM